MVFISDVFLGFKSKNVHRDRSIQIQWHSSPKPPWLTFSHIYIYMYTYIKKVEMVYIFIRLYAQL